MCYRPIHIYNPSRRWNSDAPLRIAVPCGRCSDCQRVKRNEWFFRSVIEYRHYKEDFNGSVYFVTLTYNDASLPQLELPSGDFVPAFSRKHIRNFIKYIRVFLKRRYVMSTDIKYLVCSEYGENTKRPHYHALLFFPFHFDNIAFTHLMQTCWKHGFVVCSKQGWEINCIAGIRYASKYICKDIAFDNQPWARKYLYDSRYKDWKDDHKDYFPKHWQSVGYGQSFCDVISKQNDIPAFLAKNNYTLCLGYTNGFPIPRYYHLKFEKVINKEYSMLLDKVVLEPTEVGQKVKKLRFEEAIIKDVANIKDINRASLERDMPSVDEFEKYFRFYKERHPKDCNYFSSQCCNIANIEKFDYKYFREKLLNDLPIYLNLLDTFRLSIYRVFLRYMPLFEDENPEHKFAEVTDIISNMIYPSSLPPEFEKLFVIPDALNYATPLVDNPKLKHTPTCSSSEYFFSYEFATCMLDIVSFIRGLNKEYKICQEDITKQKCKASKGEAPLIYESIIN